MTNVMTAERFKAAEIEEFSIYAERFKDFEPQRAFILAAWLFAKLRPLMQGDDGRLPADMADPAAIEALARRALHDEDWDDLQAELLETQRGRAN